MHVVAITGLVLAIGGLVALLLPGATSPPLASAGIMLLSGIAWAVYSLIGKQSNDPLASTTWNFLRAVPMMLLASIPFANQLSIDISGVLCAIGVGDYCFRSWLCHLVRSAAFAFVVSGSKHPAKRSCFGIARRCAHFR